MPASTIDTDALRALLSLAERRGDTEAIRRLLLALPAVLNDLDALNTMVALRLDGMRITSETRPDYGIRYGTGAHHVRWDPHGLPYTLAEAKAASEREGLPIVTRQRTVYEIEDETTPWVLYED